MQRPYKFLYAVPSKSFFVEFGEMKLKEKFYHDDPIFDQINAPVDDLQGFVKGEIRLQNINGKPVETTFEAWSNTYNLFVLVCKKERPLFSKRKVVIKS